MSLHPRLIDVIDQHFPNRCACPDCACYHLTDDPETGLCDDCLTGQHNERQYV